MVRLLEVCGALSIAGVAAAFAIGYMAGGSVPRGTHMAAGLVAALVALLWLTVTMFYFIATGAAVKDAVKRRLVKAESYARTKSFKGALFPPLMALIVVLIAASVTGAAFDAKKAPLIIHTVLAWLSVALFLLVYVKSVKLLAENQVIFEETVEAVNSAVDRRKGSGQGRCR